MTAAPRRTIVLSPHFDDAALSLAGLIPELPGPVVVVTVFGGAPAPGLPVSWWDSTCGFSTATEAYRARLAENARACALLGAAQIALDHPDGPYAQSPELPHLESFLSDLPDHSSILVPLGSNQPDHERVREHALRTLDRLGAPPPLVYADLPYTGHLPHWAGDEAGQALGHSPTCGLADQNLLLRYRTTVRHDLRLTDEQWARKRAAVLCHGSQLAPLAADHGSLLARGGPLRAELVWSLEKVS
ncbi:PIG-L deacetylase family protein [Kitasatospora mediocidica]|uniref:PIG-L deacetylase family protein n=1 Tax=Kitasatospora mediocidica TaxID=58352 RepID=UPI000560DAD6|nr:PIG-L family deacetylase [Kitasatospora mediocidica]